MPTGALAITARIFTSSSSLDWRIAACWRSTCWNTRASSPSSPPACGHGVLRGEALADQAQRAPLQLAQRAQQRQHHQQDDQAAGDRHGRADPDRLQAAGAGAAQQQLGRRAAEHHPVGVGHAGHRHDVVAQPARRALRLDRRAFGLAIAPPRAAKLRVGRRRCFITPAPDPCATRSMPSASVTIVVTGSWSSIAGRVRSLSSALVDSFMPPIRIACTWPSRSNSGMVIDEHRRAAGAADARLRDHRAVLAHACGGCRRGRRRRCRWCARRRSRPTATRCRRASARNTLSNRLRSTLAALEVGGRRRRARPGGRRAAAADAARSAFCSDTILADSTRPMRSALATSESSAARWLRCSIARSTSTTVSATLAAISTRLASASRILSEPPR